MSHRYALAPKREIPALLESMGTQSASCALMEHLLDTDTSSRLRVLSALTNLHRAHLELKFDAQLPVTALAADILGHYRSYQILEKLGHDGGRERATGGTSVV